jgi:hypothetical protein
MNHRIIIAIAGLVVFPYLKLPGQRSIYELPFENSHRLPPMESGVNIEEISASYQTMGNIYTTEIISFDDQTMEQTSSSYISDPLVVDAVRLMEFYMKEQLVAPGEPGAGSSEMSVIYYNESNRMNLGSAFAVLTFGFAALFGVPTHTSIADVEIEIRLFDMEEQLITSQRGVGRGKKLVTLYSSGNAGRKAHQKAMKNALEEMNRKIMTDPLVTSLMTPRSAPGP